MKKANIPTSLDQAFPRLSHSTWRILTYPKGVNFYTSLRSTCGQWQDATAAEETSAESLSDSLEVVPTKHHTQVHA